MAAKDVDGRIHRLHDYGAMSTGREVICQSCVDDRTDRSFPQIFKIIENIRTTDHHNQKTPFIE
jgi:hypothetical protein